MAATAEVVPTPGAGAGAGGDPHEVARLHEALAEALAAQRQLQAKYEEEKRAHAMTGRRLNFALEEINSLREELADRYAR